MASPLDGPRLKIERAKEHRENLRAYVGETFAVESNRPCLGIKVDPETEESVLFINYMPDLDGFLARCSLIIGDALNNLRSSLDRLAYQLAYLYTDGDIKKPNDILFPIRDSAGAFNRAKDKWLNEIHPDHIAIMERFQGYNQVDGELALGGNSHPLSTLNELVNLDKHRLPIDLVIPASGIVTPTSASVLAILVMGIVEEVITTGTPEWRVAELGVEIARSKFPAEITRANMEMGGYVLPDVFVDQDDSAVDMLDKVTGMVTQVVSEFEPAFSARTS